MLHYDNISVEIPEWDGVGREIAELWRISPRVRRAIERHHRMPLIWYASRMRISLAINAAPRVTASLSAPGYLSAHLNMSNRPTEGKHSADVRLKGIDTSHETETTFFDWPEFALSEGDVVELRILPDGPGDAPTAKKLSSEAPSNLLTDFGLAREVIQAITDFDERLIEMLNRAKENEPPEEYDKFKRAVGEVLSSTGFALAYPIYRRHKQLTPDVLKGEIL